MPISTAFSYAATVEKVVDGDTLDVSLDLGFKTFRQERLRLLGLNAPEMSTSAGKAVKLWVIRWLIEHSRDGWVQIHTRKAVDQEKYGRYLAEIVAADGACLNDDLISAGKAVRYMV